MSKIVKLFTAVLLLVGSAQSATLLVPSQYPTIQAGINAAEDGDTVLVADGTYTGEGNKNIEYGGKLISVISENGPENCIVDCEGSGRGFYFYYDENDLCVLSGFQIINGHLADDAGGGIFIHHSSPTISNCIISGNFAHYRGGGIFIGYWDAAPTIDDCVISENWTNHSGGGICVCNSGTIVSHCTIRGNWARYEGGGIDIDQSGPTIASCTISENVALGGGDCGGGGIEIYKGNPTISHCLITENTANAYGGGLLLSDAGPTVLNCTISRNSGDFGGGIYFEVYYSTTTTIVNTIIEGNQGNYGVYFQWTPDAEISFSNFCNNEQGNFYNPPAGVGALVGTNANGDSCDVFYNIFEDPLFADPAIGNFQLTWANFPIPDSTMSPCIDAGDPNSPLDPDGTIADMGCFYFDQGTTPVIEITLEPIHPPIIIPATGGRFAYSLGLANQDSIALTFDVWIMARLPDGSSYGPVFTSSGVSLSAGSSVSRTRIQSVPLPAPEGQYHYIGYAGLYGSTVYDSSFFTFMKVCDGSDSPKTEDWSNFGENLLDQIEDSYRGGHYLSDDFSVSITPNPFNPTTAVSYQLPADGYVSLKIFDISGRLVATLVDGWREAGAQEMTFDGSDLVSGVYLCKITSETCSETRKMILLK